MKKYEFHINEYGEKIKVPKNLKKLLNLQYLRLSNKTHCVGRHDLPEIICTTSVFPDFIALYNHPSDYHKTANTAVAFYLYDSSFDGIHGLYNAIYYNDIKLLKIYKDRLSNIKFFIMPDYSEIGDIDDIENHYRIKKARIVSLWLTTELNAIVIPNITYPTIDSLWFTLDGLEKCEVIAFSTMGYVDDTVERKFLIEAIRLTVDKLPLKAIIVFDVCGDNSAVIDIFQYAIDKGIKIIVPDNVLKLRNIAKKKELKYASI